MRGVIRLEVGIFCVLVGLVMLAANPVRAGILEGANLNKHLYGDQITEKDLAGKVVFVEYWGINCPPCLASFPHLVDLQKKYAPTGRFTVFASHVQQLEPAVKEFLKEKKVNFPVYNQARLKKAPCADGIPSAHLFDHNGKLVASGHPAKLYDRVARLVDAAPNPIFHGLDVQHCKAEMKDIKLEKGWAATIKSLEKKIASEGEAAEEAAQVLASFQEYLASQMARGRGLLETRPTEGVSLLKTLASACAGLPESKEAKKLAAKMTQNRDYKILAKSVETMKKIDQQKFGRSKNAKTITVIMHKLEKIVDSGTAPAGVLTEAEALLAEL